MPEVKKCLPRWMYGPNGAAEIFYTEEEIPEGWEDHPSKVLSKEKKTEETNPTTSPDKDLTNDELKSGLMAKKQPELLKMGKELGLSVRVGIKKDVLVEMIAAKLAEVQNA